MPKAPSEVAKRARDLLDKKASQDLPDAGRVKASAQRKRESSADEFFSALVEGAFLVAAADGELSDDEESTLGETIAFVTGDDLDPAELMGSLDAFAQALAEDGLDKRLAELAKAIPDEAARREVLAFSALVALCDDNYADSEQRTLEAMGKAFALDAARITSIIDAVKKSLR